jgi:uncharacterized SAM-binding protein YcdF (DUF218 family)
MQISLVSQITQQWLLPPGLNLIIALLGFFTWLRFRIFSLILIVSSFILLWLFSTPFIAQRFIDKLQRQYPVLKKQDIVKINPSSAIVILGGGNEIAPEYENASTVSVITLSRLNYGAYLYQNMLLPIITSGGNVQGTSYAEADLMVFLLKQRFKISAQWTENKSKNTAEESQYLIPILKKHKINVIYLVTNAWHMPRSMYIFHFTYKNTKLKIIAAPMGYKQAAFKQGILNFIPNLNALDTSAIALHEYIGILWYHFYYKK